MQYKNKVNIYLLVYFGDYQSQTRSRKSQACNVKPLKQTCNQTQCHNFPQI
jgi:hypothetical protein